MSIKYIEDGGYWQVRVQRRHRLVASGPKKFERRVSSEEEAIRVEKKLKQVAEDWAHSKSYPTWKFVVGEYLECCRQNRVTEDTLHDYRTALECHTFGVWRKRHVIDIRPGDIHDVIRGPSLSQRSETHKRKVFRLINRVMAFAVDKGYLGKAPKPRIIFDINNKIENVLTEPQIQEFLKKARESGNEWYPVWAVALYTGMRSGELYALRWSKVDLNEGLIKVSQSWGAKNGFKNTKGKKDRFVDIAPDLGRLLKEMREKSPNDEFVLPRIPAWKNGAQSKKLREFLVKNGLPSIRFHDLRASWATLLLRLGVTPAQLMKAAGWKNSDTMDRYIRMAGIDVKGMCQVLRF